MQISQESIKSRRQNLGGQHTSKNHWQKYCPVKITRHYKEAYKTIFSTTVTTVSSTNVKKLFSA